MSLFNKAADAGEIKEERDVVAGAGGGAVTSGIYDATIDTAYLVESAKGSLGLNIILKTDDGQFIRKQGMSNTIWMTNQKKETTFTRDGTTQHLPGFLLANNLALLTCNQEFEEVAEGIEEKTIKVYDFGQSKEVPTQVQMLMPLLGQRVKVAALQKEVDKTAKNEATGDYEPTGETRTFTDIEKFLYIEDSRTVTEIKAKSEEAVYATQFLEKWEGKVKNEAKGASSSSAKPGMPSAGNSGEAPKKKSLFS